MRLFAVSASLVCSLIVLCGCGAGGRPQALAWLGGGDKQLAKSDSPAVSVPSGEPAARDVKSFDAPLETAAHRADGAPEAHSGQQASIDPETQAAIDRELQDATPEERRQLLAEFENIDPAMIRQLLRIRRMVRQVGHHAPIAGGGPFGDGTGELSSAQAEPAASQPSLGSGAVGHSRGGGLVPQIALTSGGLGGVTPWNRSEQAGEPGAGGMRTDRPATPWVPPGTDARPSETAAAFTPPAAPVQLLPSDAEAAPSRSATSALARMVPRLDGFPSIFPGTDPPAAASNSDEAPLRPAESAGAGDGLPPAVVWQRDLENLIARLEADAAQLQPSTDPQDPATENYIEAHVYLRMLYLVAGRQEQALAHIPGVGPAVQQFWQQMLWSMANYFDIENMPDPGERATQTLLQLHAASAHLQDQARLKLANVAFCTKITSFGNYDRFDPYDFSPGQPVLLYAEVENFRSEPTTDPAGQNAFRTILQSKIEILSPAGDVRFQMDFPPTEDLCRAHRRDYFHSYEFTIPPRIPYGHHVLVLTVEDRLSQKLATYRLNFTVK